MSSKSLSGSPEISQALLGASPTNQSASSQRSGGSRASTNQDIPSMNELQCLESFERQLDKLHNHELTMLKQIDDAVTSLGVMTQILLALFASTAGSNLTAAVAHDESFTCLSGFGLVFLSMLWFVLGFGVSLFIAHRRVSHLANTTRRLTHRHKKLLDDIELYRKEFKSKSTEDVTPPLVVSPKRLTESAFGRRLDALCLRQPLEISRSYTWVITLLGISACCVAFTVAMMSWFIFCHGNGGKKFRGGLRYPS